MRLHKGQPSQDKNRAVIDHFFLFGGTYDSDNALRLYKPEPCLKYICIFFPEIYICIYICPARKR